MLRLETDPTEIAFAAQDTSELMVVHRVVQGLEGQEAFKARIDGVLGKVIAAEMIPEQDPLYGAEAAIVFGQLRRVADDARMADSPAARQMLWEFHNPQARQYAIERQHAREAQLNREGEPPISEKLRPLKAWRAPVANIDTAADLPAQPRQ